MNRKIKARAGDGLLSCVLAEVLLGKYDKTIVNFESNANLTRCWKSYSNVQPSKRTNWEYGTLMEEKIYDLFINEGYEQCKSFVIEVIINRTIEYYNLKSAFFKRSTDDEIYPFITIDIATEEKEYVIQSDRPIKECDNFIAIYGDGFTKVMTNRMDSFGNYQDWNGFVNSNNGKQTYHRIEFNKGKC